MNLSPDMVHIPPGSGFPVRFAAFFALPGFVLGIGPCIGRLASLLGPGLAWKGNLGLLGSAKLIGSVG